MFEPTQLPFPHLVHHRATPSMDNAKNYERLVVQL